MTVSQEQTTSEDESADRTAGFEAGRSVGLWIGLPSDLSSWQATAGEHSHEWHRGFIAGYGSIFDEISEASPDGEVLNYSSGELGLLGSRPAYTRTFGPMPAGYVPDAG